VAIISDGFIRFPAVDRCITVAGVNSVALPAAAILLRKCDESMPFFETSTLQRFTHRNDGRLAAAGQNSASQLVLNQHRPTPHPIVGGHSLSMTAQQQGPFGRNGSLWFLAAEPIPGNLLGKGAKFMHLTRHFSLLWCSSWRPYYP
jgi:hypothetical protein